MFRCFPQDGAPILSHRVKINFARGEKLVTACRVRNMLFRERPLQATILFGPSGRFHEQFRAAQFAGLGFLSSVITTLFPIDPFHSIDLLLGCGTGHARLIWTRMITR